MRAQTLSVLLKAGAWHSAQCLARRSCSSLLVKRISKRESGRQGLGPSHLPAVPYSHTSFRDLSASWSVIWVWFYSIFFYPQRVCKWGSVSLSSPWSTRNYSPSFHQHGTCLPPPPWQFLSPLNLKTRLSFFFFFFLTEKSFRRWFRWRRGLFSVSIFEINQHIIKCM